MIFWEGVDLRSAAWAAVQSKTIYPPTHTALIQPPILAYATLRVYENDKDPEFLDEMLPKLKKYYLWLLENRDPDDDGLISNISPYETGLDLSPAYAPPLGLKKTAASREMAQAAFGVELRNRIAGYDLEKIFSKNYFNVEDVLVNTFLAQSLRALSQLCLENEELEESQKFGKLAEKTEEAILAKCRGKDGGFYSLYTDRRGEEVMSEALTFTSLIPLLLRKIKEEDVDNLISDIFDPNKFWTPYPVPSVAVSDAAFRTGDGTMWGGSSWAPTIWALHEGLRMHGRNIEADVLSARAGYLGKATREYHNPFNGRGYGANGFTWAPALYCDMLKSVKNGNGKSVSPH
ncbi:hypothetical protein HY439_03380 [Candidatus Microgenomates bacterium]|nr:hypothetical protein [Candidatus Microgenomates bacterium]